jgi:hypothetical protein
MPKTQAKSPLPESSTVLTLSYKRKPKILRVAFKTGTEYDYKDVPESVYKKMRAAESLGKFLHQNVKGKYMHEKVASQERMIAELTADLMRSRVNRAVGPAMTQAAVSANHFLTHNGAALAAVSHTPEAFTLSVGRQLVGKPLLAATGPWFNGLMKLADMQVAGELASGGVTGGLIGAGLGAAAGGGKMGLLRRVGLGTLGGGLVGAGLAKKSNPRPGTYKTPQQLGYGASE